MKDWKVYIDDIKFCIGRILEYTKDVTYEEFNEDYKTYDAVLRNLEIIGEAVKNIPEEVKSQNTFIAWKKIAGLRDVVIHDYSRVNEEIIWDVVRNKIPELNDQINKINYRDI